MSSIKNLYAVHVGNLNAKTTDDELQILFSGTGDVKEIFIERKFNSGFTYGFVRYATLQETEKACLECHGTILHGTAIAVTLSESTNQKISGRSSSYAFKSSNKSISKTSNLPQRGDAWGKETEHEIHNKLKKSLALLKNKDDELTKWMNIKSEEDTHEFMKDFKEVLVSMSKTPHSIGIDAVMFEKDKKMSDLENLIIDFHSCSMLKEQYLPFKVVDYDLCKSNDMKRDERT